MSVSLGSLSWAVTPYVVWWRGRSRRYTILHWRKVCDSNLEMKKNSSVTSNIDYDSMSSASVTFTAVKTARLPGTFPSQGFCLLLKNEGLCLVFSSTVFVWACTFSPSLHALEAHNELVRACDWDLSAEEEAEVWGFWGWGKYTVGLFHIPQKCSN